MNNNLVLNILQKIKQKQKKHYREKFAFLIEEIRETKKDVNNQMLVQMESISTIKKDVSSIVPQLNEAIQKSDVNFVEVREIINKIDEKMLIQFMDLKNENNQYCSTTSQLLKSIISEIDKIEKCIYDSQEQSHATLSEKSEAIKEAIEDTKSLVKILAVNNLLEEIDVNKATPQR